MIDKATRRVEAGSVVRVEDRSGGFVGQAFYNPRSEIALRFLTWSESPVVDDNWFRNAIREAVSLRRDLLGLDRVSDAWRVVFAEADRLPGLIVDRFGPVLSCQIASLGAYRMFPVIRDELRALLGARTIHVSADPKIAGREGFPVPDSAGAAARTVVREHDLEYEVDCARGHKTGFFLDQRDSRLRIRRLAAGRRVLDLFCYTGGFAMNAAKGGAVDVVAVDLDEEAIAAVRANAERNGLSDIVYARHEDAFDVLRNRKTGKFDLIVVDPAKQARTRGDVQGALQYYQDINRLAFGRVAPGGLVLSCSCSGLVSQADFLAALGYAAAEARREVTFLEVTGAPPDHPVAADYPEGRYLKCVLARVK